MNEKTIIVAGVVVVGVYLFFKDEISAGLDKVNPASPDNVIYDGVNTIPDVLDDGMINDSATVGTAIADFVDWVSGAFN